MLLVRIFHFKIQEQQTKRHYHQNSEQYLEYISI